MTWISNFFYFFKILMQLIIFLMLENFNLIYIATQSGLIWIKF